MADNFEHRNGIFVFPGDKLCVIEEFIPGKGTYVEGRYSFGLNSIYSDHTVSNSKNRVLQIFFGFLF